MGRGERFNRMIENGMMGRGREIFRQDDGRQNNGNLVAAVLRTAFFTE